jgi:polysaccharide export outer membrane protein
MVMGRIMNKLCSLSFVVLSVGLSLHAQIALQPRVHPSAEYVLGPGDKIVLHVSDVDEVTNSPIRVDPGGYIDLPMAGRVEVSGKTPSQLQSELVKLFGKYVTTPEVSVNVAESSSQPVSVIGEVNAPGVHQLDGHKRLLEVISLSGGLKSDAGPTAIVTRDPRWGKLTGNHVTMNPDGYSTQTFSLDELLASSSPEDNILMEPNDVVSIPRAELVFVLGDVKKPGGFQLSTHPTLSLLQALSMAEGLGPDDKASQARILRQPPGGDGTPREIPIDIPKIVAGKAPDVPLYANDVLFVPHSGVKVTTRRAAEAAIGITTGLLIYR